MADVRERWRTGWLDAVAYDSAVERERLVRVFGKLLWGTDTRRFFRSIAELGELPAGTAVLDVPCGGGVAFRGLKPSQGLRYVAADIPPVMLGRARKEAERRGVQDMIEFAEGDVEALPFDEASFDLCLTYNSLHCSAGSRTSRPAVQREARPPPLLGPPQPSGGGPVMGAMLRYITLGAASAALALSAPASAAGPADFVGMTSGDVFFGSKAYRAKQLGTMRRAHVRLLRQTFDWASIERRRSVYDFSRYDPYVEATARRGIRLLAVLSHAPRFYERPTGGRGIAPPRSNEAMGRFAAALVQRYGRAGTFWEGELAPYRKYAIRSYQIWNEPTLPVYWRPRPNARQYGALLRHVGTVIHREDPGAEVVTAGLPNSALRGAVPLTRFIAGMYGAAGRAAFDTLAVNAYVRDSVQLRGLLRTVRKLMNGRGDRRARLWVTELGWADRGPRHRFVVGARGQAVLIRDAFRSLRGLRGALRIRGVVWYQWRDQRRPRGGSDEWGYHTGLLTLSGARKPAFRAFARYARGLGG
jgi:SAM-dependent methyltransferase